jgi:hypothetical protein
MLLVLISFRSSAQIYLDDQLPDTNFRYNFEDFVKKDPFYSYNPEKYEAFETKDGRLLCFVQSKDSSWVQCELTDKTEIENPTLWSDGSTVSRTPL